jgi:two-component system, cell cycle sensor histidine kinase and response regulator CckA
MPVEPSLESKTILLVEDNRDVSDAYTAVLETLGYRVVLAHNGEEALKIWDSERDQIALVLTDLAMPGMSGTEVFGALRDRGITAPVIMLSGYPVPTGVNLEGIADWLQKPLEVEELIAAVDRALASARG